MPRIALSLEQGTEAVPDDGRYHLVRAGSVITSFKQQAQALRAYRAERDRLLVAAGVQLEAPVAEAEVLRRQIAEAEYQDFRGGASVKKKLRIAGRRGQR